MSTKSRLKRPSRWDESSFFGKAVFTYVFPIFLKGYKQNCLKQNDLYKCASNDESEKLVERLELKWNEQLKKPKPSFAWAIIKAFWVLYIPHILSIGFQELVTRIVQPICLGKVILFFSNEEETKYEEACLYAGGVVLCSAIFITFQHPGIQYVMKQGMRTRVAACTLMYHKILRLNKASTGQTAIGQIVNIMSNDVQRFDDFAIFVPYLFIAPLQTMIVVYILYEDLGLGPSSLVGLAMLFAFIPFQSFMGRMFSKVRLATAMLTDTRLRFMSEIVSGIRVIKMYTWESPFAKRISEARESEVAKVRQSCYLKAINLSTYFVASRIILFSCFLVFVLIDDKKLTSRMVFVAMAFYNTIRLNMNFSFPQGVSLYSELKITCRRIEKFLLLEEKTPESDSHQEVDQEKCEVVINNITAKWNPDLKAPTLENVTAKLKPGDLLAVIGPVGSGKSSLLMTLLKELPLTSGDLKVSGIVSYASQESWLFNDTVRNNILFGLEFDRSKYDTITDICALRRDFSLMPQGDHTLVGEKGVSLSGGQRARINLARSIYRDADIYLCDDPLSALDASVASHIFEKCLHDYLSSKITVLVTHQLQFIQKATKILILKDGQSIGYGSYSELEKLGIDFMGLLEEEKTAHKEGEEADADTMSMRTERTISTMSQVSYVRQRTMSLAVETNTGIEPIEIQHAATEAETSGFEEETMQSGSVSGRIYRQYIQAGSGPVMLSAMLLLTFVSQVLFHGSDYFLAIWTDRNSAKNEQNHGQNSENIDPNQQTWDITVYAIIIVAMFVTTIFRSVTFFWICMKASVVLHNRVFAKLLRAPVLFFDKNPAGRILNRFTKDVGIIDEALPYTAYDLNLTLAQTIGVVITVAVVNPYLVIPAILIAILTLYIRKIYIISARDIKRLESLARSPLYSHVSTTFHGLTSIRAFGAENRFLKQFYVHQDDHSGHWFLFIATSRTMGWVMDWIMTIYIGIITFVVMYFYENLKGGEAGLAISSGLLLGGNTQWCVRQTCEFENQMISVERVIEYQELDQEAPAESDPKMKPSPQWPKKGDIEFDKMNLAYDNEKLVLKNIDCVVNGGEKIGIVGRTGAGKSSIIAALFRLTEPSGRILIDGIDVQNIGLDDLRRKISIIPQDPVVFSGTVRYNLDPFDEFGDSDLWQVLDKVQLKKQFEDWPGKLDAQLNESGSNLSVGQRQLICLARAILRNNRVLVLDEATANVDHQTDNQILTTIRTEFANCTVLTIAHRLNTIIDSDRVLVLDAGKIVEFDEPIKLLRAKGTFFDMCRNTGNVMFAHLYRSAQQSAQRISPDLYEDRLV